jgi:ribonuclease BN (tRNA processing enzyme)
VFVSHLHGDHFGGLPFLILDGQFSHRTGPLAVVGPPGTATRLADTMECLFPGSSTTPRRFAVEVTELAPGTSTTLCGVAVRAWEAGHPSGAPALLLRLDLAGKTIAYTGDTAWTGAIAEAAANGRCTYRRTCAHGIQVVVPPIGSWMMPFGLCSQACSHAVATGSQLGALLR